MLQLDGVSCRLQGPNTLHGPFVVWIDLFLFTNLISEMIICLFFSFIFLEIKKRSQIIEDGAPSSCAIGGL